MNKTIVTSMVSMAGLGFFFASILAIVNEKLKVKEDPRVEKLEAALPGVNCGACGFASCRQYAESLAKGESTPIQCKAGGSEVIGSLSGILGVGLETKAKEMAIVHCGADASKRSKKAVYFGMKTCAAAKNVQGGEILCDYGCLGYGDCKTECPFGAITLVNGLPGIDKEKCTACGKCAKACPCGLITLEKIDSRKFLYVACSNMDKGPETRKTCAVGCIACGICQRLTAGIFHIDKNAAYVNYDKIEEIEDADEVVGKCPTKCILKI
ncbi:MAG: RnfABCDGE type electron transport complex subunit B [Candidatus Omnitrophota bacterium]